MKNVTKSKNVCVGCLWMGDEEHSTKIYVDKNGIFLNVGKDLQDWAYALNTPWSDTSTHYVVHPNYCNDEEWIAERTVIVYDSIEARIMAAGETPQKAIENCDEFMRAVIKKYYVDDEEEN